MNTQGYYDPLNDEIVLRPDASLYCRFHEEAHREQYKLKPILFCLCLVARAAGANYLATLWIEYDALRRARRVMKSLGVWSEKASTDAFSMFSTYVRRKEI